MRGFSIWLTCFVLASYLIALAFQPTAVTNNSLPHSQLTSVSFSNANDGWAVGSVDTTTGEGSLCIHWDGTNWTRFSCLGSTHSGLNGVKAISPNDVWAVGLDGEKALAVHWDGKTWTRVAVDTSNDSFVALVAVTATSSHDVWATGFTSNGVCLIVHWDGRVWKVSYRSRPHDSFTLIPAVSAESENNVWSVLNEGDSDKGPIFLHWDGKGWKQFFLSKGELALVNGILAERTNAWAVGWNEPNDHNLIARWDGSAWSIVPSIPLGDHDELNAVANVSDKELWAVGSTFLGQVLLLEHWNGSKWELIDTKDGGELKSLAVVSTTNIWAVGRADTDALIGHWDGAKWRFSKPFVNSSSGTHK